MSQRPPPAAGEESAHALLAQLARALGVPPEFDTWRT